jgi:hypothetical protein
MHMKQSHPIQYRLMQYLRYYKGRISDINFNELIAEDRPAEIVEGQFKRIERLVFLQREVYKCATGKY